MQFSDTTNKNGLIQKCEFFTGMADAQISGNATLLKQFTSLINDNYLKIVALILLSQDEWDYDDNTHGDFPIMTADLVASQQDYSMPTGATQDILQVKRLEVSYDGTNWYKAEPIDLSEIGTATDTTTIGQQFDKTKPFYDVQYNSIFLYPIPDTAVTGGLKFWITRAPDLFTSSDTTQKPGIDTLFHPMIAWGAARDWAIIRRLDNVSQLEIEWRRWEEKLVNYIGKKQKDRNDSLQSAYINYN